MHALAALLLVGWLAAETPAAAPPPGRVALIRDDGDERLYVRLAAELRTQRFEVIDFASTPGTAPARALTEALRATGAEAAMRVDLAPEALRIWIANGVSGKQV